MKLSVFRVTLSHQQEMKFLIVVALIVASSEAFLKSGTLNLSGSFQAHPLLANHLAKHKLLGGSQPQPVEAAPVVVETPITESPVPVQSDAIPTQSFHSKIDFNKLLKLVNNLT